MEVPLPEHSAEAESEPHEGLLDLPGRLLNPSEQGIALDLYGDAPRPPSPYRVVASPSTARRTSSRHAARGTTLLRL
jgi:hypothetical protein